MHQREEALTSPALSTMWMQKRFSTVSEFWARVQELGLDRIELSSVVRPEMVEGLLPGDARIASVHSPCPSTVGLGDEVGLLLSSLDPERRQAAVRTTEDAIDYAARYGAGAVVAHLGYVVMDRSAGRELGRMFIAHQEDQPRYAELRSQVVATRQAAEAPHLEAVRRSLDALEAHARKRGVRLGFENLPRPWGIPSVEEAAALLAEHDPAVVYYWHDTGHAQVMHNLGFVRHEKWLETLGSRMLGMHLHDVKGVQDHLCCGLGEIDWTWIARYLRPDSLRTCEFDYYFEGEHVQRGVEVLREAGCL
jgi:sugar phosphate isomerase/epimerase